MPTPEPSRAEIRDPAKRLSPVFGGGREPAHGDFDDSAVLIEMVSNDRLDSGDLACLSACLARRLEAGDNVTPAESVLDAAGTMWWLCLYLWCLTPRALAVRMDLMTAALGWARRWRARDPRARPVYLATLDEHGQALEVRLLRRGVELVPRQPARPRLPPRRLSA
jgi:hypothetical protein